MNQAECIRLSQTQRTILDLLRAASPRGLTTWQIIDQTHHSRAAGRLWELKQAGYPILKVEGKRGKTLWFYAHAQMGLSL